MTTGPGDVADFKRASWEQISSRAWFGGCLPFPAASPDTGRDERVCPGAGPRSGLAHSSCLRAPEGQWAKGVGARRWTLRDAASPLSASHAPFWEGMLSGGGSTSPQKVA